MAYFGVYDANPGIWSIRSVHSTPRGSEFILDGSLIVNFWIILDFFLTVNSWDFGSEKAYEESLPLKTRHSVEVAVLAPHVDPNTRKN